ncbi:MAG: Ca-activated chloride channel, partial [Solirubrobacteraceae bacterium]|nr:Ca-activated chloride channel [Solirubrobacteraceae bacterium]
MHVDAHLDVDLIAVEQTDVVQVVLDRSGSMDLDLSEETVSLQICVNVVPGDEAAGRVPDPKVRTELLFQQAQEAKRQAADAIARGDHDDALQTLAAAGESLA